MKTALDWHIDGMLACSEDELVTTQKVAVIYHCTQANWTSRMHGIPIRCIGTLQWENNRIWWAIRKSLQ